MIDFISRSPGARLGNDEQSVSDNSHLSLIRLLQQGFGTETNGEPKTLQFATGPYYL